MRAQPKQIGLLIPAGFSTQACGDVSGAQKLSRHSKLETLMIYDDAREDLQGRATRLLSELA